MALEDQDEAVRRAAAVKRTLLWEHLREQVDDHQLRAVHHARAAGVEWAASTAEARPMRRCVSG